ncbi:MAG: hypothetical protein ABEI27_10655 [Halobellus sp.]|uniref:hypothetical protein n=1 Tax=Halobellus sp. TaxID=1979212 RepID=UPI0035D3E06A
MDEILNEVTNTIHKQEPGNSALTTPCGVTNNLSEDRLQQTAIEQLDTTTITKCGRCFDDGGGY